jgi:inhibitor of KinA sporulation pathway (predicted exonuclease)
MIHANSILTQTTSKTSLLEILKSLKDSCYFSSNPIKGFSSSETEEIISELLIVLSKSSQNTSQDRTTLTQFPTPQFSLIHLNSSNFPRSIIHGTSKSAFKSIKSRGLFKMHRNFIFFSNELPAPKKNIEGSKLKNEVFLYLDPEASISFFEFFLLNSSTILSKGKSGFISPFFFSKVLINRIERPFSYNPALLDYFIVIDLDATCCESRKIDCQEIIEFPAEIINSKTLETEFKFHRYVRPTVLPVLTTFCVEFTGIQQETVDQAGDIFQVFQEFEEFLRISGIWGKKWIFATCGDWDLGVCLKKELEFKGVKIPKFLRYWGDVKKMIPGFKKGDVLDICRSLGVEPAGRRHCGIDDCRNTANCLKALLGAKVLFLREDISGNLEEFDEFIRDCQY